jgi:uncharacterized protein YdhG (YjbR/CyaY superfamily)
MKKSLAQTIKEYITEQPKEHQERLEKLYALIRKSAPQADELISYQMPAFKFNGPLVYFALQKNHIGFYPLPSAIREFKKELSDYKSSKGAVQFPLDKPLPVKLISSMVKFRYLENKIKDKKKLK